MAKVKKKKVTLPNTGEIAKKTDYSVIVDGDKNGIDTVEKNMTVSYKTKHVTQQLHFGTLIPEKLKLISTSKFEH